MSDTIDLDPEETGDLYNAAGEPLTARSMEKQLLGFLLGKPEQIDDVMSFVTAGDFFDPFHRRIFEVLAKEGWGVGMEALITALGGDKNLVIAEGKTIAEYIGHLIVQADSTLDASELATIIQECSERRAMDADDFADDVEGRLYSSQMGLKMWADQNAPGPETDYIVEDLIPESQLVLLIGETQTGKSFLATHMGACLARAVPFFGRRILEAMGVIWCAYEAATGAPARMRGYTKAHNLDVEDLPFAALQQPLTLWPNLDNAKKLIEEFRAIEKYKFRGRKLGLIVVDTLNTATPGASEIDSEVVSRIRGAFHHIIKETGATLMIVGHVNAAGKHRGNEQIVNNADTVLKVSKKTRTEGRELIPLKDDDGREIRTLKVIKQREGLDGQTHDFVLRVVEDGTKNKYGKARTTCVIANPNIADAGDSIPDDKNRETPSGAKVSKMESIFLNCLMECLDEYGVTPPPEIGLPRSIGKVVEYDHVKRLMFTRMLREDDNTEAGKKRHRDRVQQANKRARQAMMHIKVVGCHDPFIWWTGKSVRGIKAMQTPHRSLFDHNQPEPDFPEEDFPPN